MRGQPGVGVMRERKITALICILCLSVVGRCAAQECASLQHASPTQLVSYLDGVRPNEENAECITVAIKRLTPLRFEPAIPVLAKLLDFRRPPTKGEKFHFYLRPQIPEELYPAAGALEEIGEKALPSVLDVIKTSSSTKARDNAVTVWMEIHKYEPVKGVASLRQEAIVADDPKFTENLKLALSKAVSLCFSKGKIGCDTAAIIPKR